MNPLLNRLASLRRKVRLLEGWQGVCALLTLLVGVGLAVGTLDYWIHLPSLVRALALVGMLLGGAAIAYAKIYRPLVRSCDDLSLALRVEEIYPQLNDALASTVQFLKHSKEDQERIGGSEPMRQITIQETLGQAEQCDFGRVLDRRAAWLFGLCAVGVLTAAGVVIGMNTRYAGTALLRLVEPFGQHTWTRITVALSQPDEEEKWRPLDPTGEVKDYIAVNRPYQIKVDLAGKIPHQALIEIQGKIRTDKPQVLKPAPDGQSASFVTSIDMTQQAHQFKYRIIANDGSFPPRRGSWHVVEVKPPPSLIDLEGQKSPQITIYPPEYTELPSPQFLPPGTPHLEIYAGSNIVFRAKADRPLEKAWIEYRVENHDTVMPASIAAFVGQTHPLGMLGAFAGSQAVWGRIEGKLDRDQRTFQIRFMPWLSGFYVLRLRDKDRLEGYYQFNLNVQKDPLPNVEIIRPSTSVTVLADADVPFKFKATDEIFALRSVYVEYFRKALDDTPLTGRKKTVLYTADSYGKLIPALLSRMGKTPLVGPDLHLRYKQLDFEVVWALKNEKFKEGEMVEVQVCADDFCNVYLKRAPGRSHSIQLRIVSRLQLLSEVNAKLREVQIQLKLLEKQQDSALSTTEKTKKKAKFDRAVKDEFVEGEQTQREVQNKIGRAPEDGLRHDLNEIRKLLKDNKLTNTPPFKLTEKIKGTLDQLAAQELQQIEPKLAELRNDLAQNEKNNPKIAKNLTQTARLQDKVLKALQELNQELAPEEAMANAENKLRNILEKQQALENALEQMKKEREDVAKNKPQAIRKVEEEQKNQLKLKAQEQQDLAQDTEKLADEMKALLEKREKEGDKVNAQKLKDALQKLAPNDPTSKKMKDAANDLKNQPEPKEETLQQMKNIKKDLDDALAALEQRKKDQHDFLKDDLKDRKIAEQKIDAQMNQLKELQKEAKDLQNQANKLKELQKQNPDDKKLKDEQERLHKKQEELAQKLDKLQQEMEKTSRQLARLQEERPANNLNEAADNVQKGAEKIQNGEDGQQDLKQAQKQLEEAKKQVQQAEQELSREMLVQLHDKLKGLKERQDAALERSEKLHKKIMRDKSWRDSYLDTIEGTIDAQKGIADETDTLKDKLKQTKVFHGILDKAKGNMDKAVERMTNRRDEGKELRYIEKGDGERMDADQLKDEVEGHTFVARQQKQAAQRLDRLLDALKQELAKKDKKPPEQVAKDDENKDKEKEQPQGQPDPNGVPQSAQIKALRAEQQDLLERTEEFAKKHADVDNLPKEAQTELQELTQEQERLQSLFRDLVAPPQKEGEMP